MKFRHFATALLCTFATPLAAQAPTAGTATFHMSVHPAEASPVTPGVPAGTVLETDITYITDGHRFGMEMIQTLSTMPQLSGMRTLMIFTPGSDTVHMGILYSPEMAATIGSPGSRMDLTMAALTTAGEASSAAMDSIIRVHAHQTYRALGTTATVAGIVCQEWEIVAGADTSRTCVIPTPPALASVQDQLKTLAAGIPMVKMAGLDAMQKDAYGGQALMAIRTISPKMGMTMELTSFKVGAPDPSRLELPAGLQVMPMPGGG